MAIINKSDLNRFYKETQLSKGFSKVASIINESKDFKDSTYETLVFLSHKHNERDKVKEAILLLREYGSFVYVDWLDSSMPPSTNADTAKKLKQRIKQSKKFVLLATEDAISIKRCNWEFGIGDGIKTPSNIALLPVSNDYQSYTGSEYLKIYPHIEKINSTYYVINTKENRTKLRSWLI